MAGKIQKSDDFIAIVSYVAVMAVLLLIYHGALPLSAGSLSFFILALGPLIRGRIASSNRLKIYIGLKARLFSALFIALGLAMLALTAQKAV